MKYLLLVSTIFLWTCIPVKCELELNVIHINDFHDRFEEISWEATRCKDPSKCIGGFSRLYYQIKQLLKKKNAVLLNAGDNCQGTIWFRHYKHKASVHFMNKLPWDATTLGNHEFDNNIAGIVPYMKEYNSPIVCCNIDDSKEPTFKGLYKKSTVIEREGKKICIIGALTKFVPVLSLTGNLSFHDELESINAEAARVIKSEGCKIVIALTHVGYKEETDMAAKLGPNIHVIIGGHSHSFLWTGPNPPGPNPVIGPYPTIVDRGGGRKVLVTQAALYSKYIGVIQLIYNDNGDLLRWSGKPIFVGHDIPQDPDINAEIAEWKKEIDATEGQVLGKSNVLMDVETCRDAESNIGNFLTESYVDYYATNYSETGAWTYAAIAMVQAGGIRTSLSAGELTVYDLVEVQPFYNYLVVGDMTGKSIKEALEYCVSIKKVNTNKFRFFLQLTGLRVTYDIAKNIGSRVISLKAICRKCMYPVWSDVKMDETYRVIVTNFLASGGDGFKSIKDNLKNQLKEGEDLLELYKRYAKKMSPLTTHLDERIIVLNNRSTSVYSTNVIFYLYYMFSILFCFNLNVFSQ